jgi:subtilisin family serine protease
MNMRYGEFYHNEPQRSLADEAAARWAYAVAAVDVDSLTREEYSSQGRAYGEGGAITGGINQPFLAGFANVDTLSYGSGVFNGTSSATPHVAGAAALVWSAYPDFNALQVRRFLNKRAMPIGSQVGYDNANGHGWLWLGDPDLPPGGLSILQLLLPPSVE